MKYDTLLSSLVYSRFICGGEEMIKIKADPDLYPEAVALLIEHGCEVKTFPTYLEVTLPEGSTRKEIFFRSVLERYKLVLPGGLEMKKVYNRFIGRSSLYFYIG